MKNSKTLTLVLTVGFLIVAAIFGYLLVDGIKSKIDQEKRVERIENQIIRKLKIIRAAQVNYQKFYSKYAGDWDSLKAFLDTGFVYQIEKTEHVIPLSYGRDSVYVEYDTLGTTPADSLILWEFVEENLIVVDDNTDTSAEIEKFKEAILPNFSMIPPKNEEQFELYAGELARQNSAYVSYVPVFEVKDVSPVNPERRRADDPLRVGSRTQVSSSGNWEE